jgi:hypothetical protein
MIGVVVWIQVRCPEKPPGRDSLGAPDDTLFRVPWMPYVPCLGIFINYVLVAQLQWLSLVLIIAYVALAVAFYFLYSMPHSVGNNTYWSQFKSTLTNEELDKLLVLTEPFDTDVSNPAEESGDETYSPPSVS